MPDFDAESSLTTNTPGVICENFVLGFALWTVLCHLTVFTGGNLFDLLVSFGATGSVLLLWHWYRGKRALAQVAKDDGAPEDRAQTSQRIQVWLVWLLVVMMVGLTLIAHRPDEDDCRYVNRAVAVADHPRAPILQYDTMHLHVGVPIETSSKVISNEMLAGAISWLTGLPAIAVFHLLFAPVAAMLAVLAYSELFRLLSPKYWGYGVLAVIAFLIANGQAHTSYGNFSFVRLHQGKGVLVSVLVPLLITYGLRFATQPTVRNWLLLNGTQLATVGMSSTGMMVAPVVAVLSVLTGVWGMHWTTQTKRFAVGFGAPALVVVVGCFLRLGPILRSTLMVARRASAVSISPEQAAALQQHYRQVFHWDVVYFWGNGRFAVVCLIIAVTAWIWCETKLARRLCLIFPIVVGVVFANPVVFPTMVRYFTGEGVYWRVFWLLPLPAMAGLTLLAPLTLRPLQRFSATFRYATYGVLLVLLVSLATEQHIFKATNRVTLKFPGLKVPAHYEIATFISALLDNRPNVLAPETISAWLPTIHHHPYPLIARQIWAARYFSGPEQKSRMALTTYITGEGRPVNAPDILRTGLQTYQIAAVVMPLSNAWAAEIRTVLKTVGFEQVGEMLGHEIWLLRKNDQV